MIPKSSREPGDLYRSIGVRPIINARGTFTIITGSTTLPEVKRAMEEASRCFVNMDELMEGVGKRLADITGADWGMVTNGCAAALTACTAASIAGGNPERLQRLPNLAGLKNEVIVPAYSRNMYDHAVRMLGVKLIVAHDAAELERAFNDRTAMVYILAGPGDDGSLGTRAVAEVARRKRVPVLVDAAAEVLTVHPNVHLERGATAVAYSGGKCMRGPQAAGLLLGDKNLLQAAWINSAPHHAFGRSLKVGKEEIMGMLTAVETWVKRDHAAEWKQWERWLGEIEESVEKVKGVEGEIIQPGADLSNRSPSLKITWDREKLGITGQEISRILLETEPRIVLASAEDQSISIVPYQMTPGDETVVARRLFDLLSQPPTRPAQPPPAQPAVNVAGDWLVRLAFMWGSAIHKLRIEQNGSDLGGTYQGEFASGPLKGTVMGAAVRFEGSYPTEGTDVYYQYMGTVEGQTMSGEVDLGQYGSARWTAERA